MANINHKWKKLLGVCCTHARYVDPQAWASVLEFKERWKPHLTAHLGDFVDLTSLMSGAKGVSEAEPLIPDIDTGLQHLRELRPQIVLCGNHEVRAFKLLASPSAPVAYASHKIVEAIEKTCQKLKARLVPYNGVFQMVDVADIGFQHGVLFNEMAARDTAEAFCNTTRRKVVFGHTHKVSIQSSRTLTGGTGYNIGCLTQRGGMDYANTRRATLAWTQAFLWGEYCEELNQSSLHITQRNPNETWRLPL